ncbi:MAG: hypothetical protein ACRD5G_07795 [Candidatus Acidiferrales bacterium]
MDMMNQKTVKRFLYGLVAIAAFWWAAEGYLESGLGAPTFLFGGLGIWLGYSAATGAG